MLYRRILSIMIPVIMCPIISFADYQAIVNIDTLNIRDKKDSSSTVVGEVTANSRFDVTIDGEKWLKTKVKNKDGYLFQEYVDLYEVTSFGDVTFKHSLPMKDSTMTCYKGEILPAYDYFNGYYLVKKNYQYFYVHDSVVSVDKKSDIEKPIVIKHGVSTKSKSDRLEKEEATKTNQDKVKVEPTDNGMISIFDNNQTELVFSDSSSSVGKTVVQTAAIKLEDNIDLFNGYEIDIESIEQNAKINNKQDNKKDSKQSSKQDNKKDSKQSSKQDNRKDNKQSTKLENKRDNKQEEVSSKNIFDSNTSNYTNSEIDIESVVQNAKIKLDNKEEVTLKNASTSDKSRYSKFLSDNGLDKFVSQSDVLSYAVEELGKPYVYGATGPSKFDCSGFTSHIFKKAGISIPRTSYLQAEKGESIDRNSLKSGDLVFFDTRSLRKLEVNESEAVNNDLLADETNETGLLRDLEDKNSSKDSKKKIVIKPSKVTHVGIYIGDGKFIHASSGQKRVVINELDSKYYSERYYGAKRYR